MSNLRSDALDFIKGRKPGDKTKVFIEYLCAQIDQIEEWWHEEGRKVKALRERDTRIAQELLQIDAFVSEVDHLNRDRVRKSLIEIRSELLKGVP